MKVVLQNISKRFQDVTAVDNVTFDVENGELVTLLGPSGCGKTTVLRMIAGLEEPTDGLVQVGDTVFFDGGRSVPPNKRGIGMVFQSFALWPHRTVFQNVSFPLEIQKVPPEDLKSRVKDALKLVSLAELSHRYPNELSGGQQQRVAVARAIAQKPRVLLMDEPLSSLDTKLREQMRREIRSLQKTLGLTLVYVTHDRAEALELSDRMAIMDHGKLVQIGTPEAVVRNPANEFVAQFLA